MKFMNMKRFGSVVMAGALALSLTVPAFAGSATPAADPNTTKVEGAYKDIEINVVVPESGNAQINPYGLPVSISKSDMTTADITNQKITSLPLTLRNQGTVDLDVNASLLVTPKGDVSIGAAKDTGKTIAVDLEVVGLDDAKYALSTMDPTLEDLLIDAFADDATWASAGTLAAPTYAKGGTAPAAAKSGSALATLGAAVDESGMVTYGNDSIAVFRLTGDVAEEPVKAAASGGGTEEDPWKETDAFTATIVFKFKPAAPSAGDAAVTVTISGTTATATFDAGTSGLTAASYAWSSSDENEATVSGTTTTGTIAEAGTATSGNTADIIVTVTLSNGATITGQATYTVA